MNSLVRKSVVPLFAGAALVVGGAAPASAQVQDGLVNVVVGDIIINDAVDAAVGAQVAANICGVNVGPVAVLASQVDQTGVAAAICTNDQAQTVTITDA